ncbi:MAG: hypothetical protein KDC54_15585, partial [Lewinella sp.]|nr:hypothetical protein [Lewinella sp.]
GFTRNSKVNELSADNTEVNAALDEMAALRDDLARQVDSLASEYDILAVQNEELSGSLAQTQEDLARAQAAVDRARRNAAAEVNDLRAQINDLLAARSGLESSIMAMQAENDSLRVRTGLLEDEVALSQEENEALQNMNRAMEGEIRKLTLENFKATAFTVTPLLRRGVATTRASRARSVSVEFDLANVPPEYQGLRSLYLVITDESGTPIPSTKAIPATATVNGQRMDLMALETRDENITESQRLTFEHTFEQKLDEGYYRAAVYTDIGLLGAANFRLR